MSAHSYETVIGLEIHVQLSTKSKAFCADDAAFGGAPNTHTSAISLAHPGTLPRLNRRAVEYAVRLGLALGCRINLVSSFDRKNYFYADLPKGYQITQDKRPICTGGRWTVGGGRRTVDGGRWTVDGSGRATPSTVHRPPSTVNRPPSTVRIHHIHLEEDAGKSLHDQDPLDSLVDLNRAGVPLLEIVTEPDLRSPEEVAAFMENMRRLVRWLDISDGNMEEGSLRCDINVSVRKTGETAFGQRCEIKNVNSMRFARRAAEYEANRQIGIIENGGRIEQETRGFDPSSGATYSLREKEQAHDYRYFPEPDLPPVIIRPEELEHIRAGMPPLPDELEREFQTIHGLSAPDAAQLTREKDTAFYFLELIRAGAKPKIAANLLINKLIPWAAENNRSLDGCPVSPGQWTAFLQLTDSGQVSASAAYQRLFPGLLEQPNLSPAQLAANLNLLQTSDSDFLETLAEEVLARFPDKVQEYKKGKKGLMGLFMGELMKASKGKADPKAAAKALEEKLH